VLQEVSCPPFPERPDFPRKRIGEYTELIRIAHGQIHEVEVYFGRDLEST
jgi:hypothetical protein